MVPAFTAENHRKAPYYMTPQGCIFTLRLMGRFGISVEKYVGTSLLNQRYSDFKNPWRRVN